MTLPTDIQLDEFSKIRASLKRTFASGKTKVILWRQQQLLQLARLVQENAEALAESIFLDMGKPRLEVYLAESWPIIERSLICAKKVAEWAKGEDKSAEVDDWMKSWQPRVRKEPKGVALIIAPWNYPLILSLQPLYGAISAGCCAVIKPSEIAPHYSSLLAQLIPRYLDSDAYKVVEGAVPEITRLLELQWDHIFYTGNAHIARIISAAAARHLTPITLELGGKSPVIIDVDADIDVAAKRILYGKSQNAGQLCVSPDYVLCPKSILEPFKKSLAEHAKAFWPEGSLKSASFSRIVSNVHYSRLSTILQNTHAKVIFGGKKDFEGTVDPAKRKRGLELTIFELDKEHWHNDVLMKEELFGPFLPILPVDDVDEAIRFVNRGNHPLVLYSFTQNEETKNKILRLTQSGSAIFNDTVQHLACGQLPFGGVGESGYGRQVLKCSFDLFSYERPVADFPYEEKFNEVRYAPYTDEKFNTLSTTFNFPIPSIEDL